VKLILPIKFNVGHLDHRALENCSAGSRCPTWRGWKHAACDLKLGCGPIVSRGQVDQFAIESRERTEKGAAQSGGAVDDRIKDRLDVCRRQADHS
jgi:hypothetical protein